MAANNQRSLLIQAPKLYSLMALIAFFMILASSLWTAVSINNIINNSFQMLGAQASEGLANAVAENVIKKEYAAIEASALQTLSNENILSAVITDSSGKVVVNLIRNTKNNALMLDFSKGRLIPPSGNVPLSLASDKNNRLFFWHPIIAGINIGWVRVEISTLESDEVYSALRMNSLLVIFLFLGTFVLLGIWKLRNYFSEVIGLNKKLADQNSENTQLVVSSYLLMMESLGMMIAKRDSDTGAHNYRVTYIAILIAEKVQITRDKMKSLIVGSFLHDIGKIAITDTILLKPGKLTDQEWITMKMHVSHGEQMVKHIGLLSIGYEIVANHHEKWNGSGYPRGLSGSDIPLIARIFMVADTFDALCSKRPYKKSLSYEESMKIIHDETPSHFDPEMIAIFKLISKEIYDKLALLKESDVKDLVRKKAELYFYENPTLEDMEL
ncbi:MAG: HD-GYP domain-containing protein [Polynucleobacter sp.]